MIRTQQDSARPSDSGPPAVPAWFRRVPWVAMAFDVMAAAWMLAAGDWLDRFSRLTAVVTLGGHHVAVLSLAVAGFVLLAALAVVTGGFLVAGRVQLALVALAVVVSIVATAGILSVVVGVVGVALVGRLLLR